MSEKPSQVDHKVFKPFTIEDVRGFKKQCEICNRNFNMITIEHKCKRCLRSICIECGKKKAMIYKQDGTKKQHRICTVCENEYTLIGQYRDKYKLSFGNDSEFSNMWVKKLNRYKKSYSQILTEYTECLSVTNQNVLKFKRQSRNILSELFPSYNYSFRNFISVIRTTGDDFQEKIVNVSIAVLARLPGLAYFPELIYVVVFFLSFASECHAYLITTAFIEKVFPLYQSVKKLRRDNLLSRELRIVVHMTEILAQTTNKDDIVIIKQYLEARMAKFLASLTVNIYSFEVTLHIIHETIMKGSHLELYKGVTSVTFLAKAQIANRKTYDQIELTMLRSVSLEDIKSLMGKFDKVELQYDSVQQVHESHEYQRLAKQFKLMEASCSTLEEEISRKSDQVKTLQKKLRQNEQALESSTQNVDRLTEQLYLLGDKRKQISQFNNLKQKYQRNQKQLQKLEIENGDLKKKLQQQSRRMFVGAQKLKWLQRTNNQYEKELIQLRSTNDILQVKVEAKNIDFNTDRIEKQIKDKNTRIKQLQKQVYVLQTQLEFQKQNTKAQIYTLTLAAASAQPMTSEIIEDDTIKTLESQIELGTKIINKQKTTITQITEELKIVKQALDKTESSSLQSEKRIKYLEQSLGEFLKCKERSDFDVEDPQQLNLLDQQITRQEDFIRKNTLITIKNRFEQCHNELKMTKFDSKMKSEKLVKLQKGLASRRKVSFAPDTLQVNRQDPPNTKPDECLLF